VRYFRIHEKLPFKKIEIKRSSIYVLAGYTILTLILTYPMVLNLNTQIVGSSALRMGGGNDYFGWPNLLWWFDKAVTELGINPLHNSYYYYPVGMDHSIGAFLAFHLFPITHFLGTVTTYNVYLLLTFIISGFSAYLLVKYLTKDMKASFIAGIVYSFSPFHFAHAITGHMNIISIQWIPLYVLFLIKMMKNRKRSDTFLCATFFSLSCLSSWYFGIYLVVFSALYIFGLIYINRKDTTKIFTRDFLKEVMLFLITSTIIVGSFVLVVVKNMLTNPDMYKPLSDFILYGADVLGFVVPSPHHTIFGEYTWNLAYRHFTGNTGESTTYIGYTVLILVLFAVWKAKEKKVKFFALASLIFLILSLGPTLHFKGVHTPLILPYLVFYYLPFFSMARVPSRVVVMLMLMLAVLVGYGISAILERMKNANLKLFVCVLIGSLIIFEFLAIPIPMTDLAVSDFYYQMSNDTEEYAVLEVPINRIAEYIYYQSIHGKKLVGGDSSRESYPFFEFIYKTPVFQNFKLPQRDYAYLSGCLNQNISEIGRSVLKHYNVKYVIIHKDMVSSLDLEALEELTKKIGVDLIFEDDSIIVYEVKVDVEDLHPFMMVGENWLMYKDSVRSNYMGNNTSIVIVNPTNQIINAQIQFTVYSFQKPRTLRIYEPTPFGVEIISYQVQTKQKVNFTLEIQPGENEIWFVSQDAGTWPHNIEDLADEPVSFLFENVELIYNPN